MSLKIIEPVQTCLKSFDCVQAFEKYYMKHREAFEGDTTHMLNKKYKIDGYRITRIKGELQLKRSPGDGPAEVEGHDALMLRVQKLEHLVDELVSRYNSLIQHED